MIIKKFNILILLVSIILNFSNFINSRIYAYKSFFDHNTLLCKITKTKYDLDGYDIFGYDRSGHTRYGFDKLGINRFTGTKFSNTGYYSYDGITIGIDVDGYSQDGVFCPLRGHFVDNLGFCGRSYDCYNSKGFNIARKHYLTGTEYDPEGYNVEGFDKNGIHKETGTIWSPGGFDVHGYSIKLGRYLLSYHLCDSITKKESPNSGKYDPNFSVKINK